MSHAYTTRTPLQRAASQLWRNAGNPSFLSPQLVDAKGRQREAPTKTSQRRRITRKKIVATLTDIKQQAHRLLQYLAEAGIPLRQSQAFESIAAIHGHRNWNTLRATVDDRSEPDVEVTSENLLTRLEQDVWDAFLDLLPQLSLAPTLKGTSPMGFRAGNRLYLIESKVLEQVRTRFAQENQKSWEFGGPVDRIIEAALSSSLIGALTKKHWLVSHALGMKGPSSERWRIQYGNVTYTGVLVLRIPSGLELKQPNSPAQLTVLDSMPRR